MRSSLPIKAVFACTHTRNLLIRTHSALLFLFKIQALVLPRKTSHASLIRSSSSKAPIHAVMAGLASASASWRWYGRATASALAFAATIAGILSFVSLYVYEHPNHHCPFCILKPEYGYQGYLLYLPLFVATAAIITSALSASLESLDRQRRTLHASNLANSVMAELQLGIRAPGNSGAQPFEAPFDQWTWELAVTSSETETGESSDLTRAEVIIRHKEFPTVRRLAQLIAFDRSRRTATPAPAPGTKAPTPPPPETPEARALREQSAVFLKANFIVVSPQCPANTWWDDDGVLVIPPALVREVADAAVEQERDVALLVQVDGAALVIADALLLHAQQVQAGHAVRRETLARWLARLPVAGGAGHACGLQRGRLRPQAAQPSGQHIAAARCGEGRIAAGVDGDLRCEV